MSKSLKTTVLFLSLAFLLSACSATANKSKTNPTNNQNMPQNQTQINKDQLNIAGQNPANNPNAGGQNQNIAEPAENSSPSSLTTVNELQSEDIQVGTGTEAKAGNMVTVHYTGTLTDGKKFDSSIDRGQAFTFNLGAGQVIKGWDQGVVGMKVGGKRKLTIPASLAYGDKGAGGVIPPGATLVFEIELLDVR
jgi:FKBP-type peptidyl-prolyl cis-trans isomerase FkpA